MSQPRIGAAPNAAPLTYCQLNAEWAGFLIGLLEAYQNPKLWEGTEQEQADAVDQVELLQYLLMGGYPAPILVDDDGYAIVSEIEVYLTDDQ